jgi:ATP-binding cassette subfamily G (WHITE) protein 2 (SNQ2)
MSGSESAAQSEHPEEAHDSAALSELPTREALAAHVTRSPSISTRSPNLPSQRPSPNVPSTSLGKRPQRERQPSCAGRVDVDFFDPHGVRNLNRTLSHMSVGRVKEDILSISGTSDETLIPEGPFDFEKTLRTLLRRYVSVLIPCLMAADVCA